MATPARRNQYSLTKVSLGYHAEHNFGHGKKNLSFNFFLFTLLAFFMHQIIELRDPLYQIVPCVVAIAGYGF
jgi:hypothetical protein